MRVAALTLGARAATARRRTAVVVAVAVFFTALPTGAAAAFTGVFFAGVFGAGAFAAAVLGTAFPTLDRYRFFFAVVEGAVVLLVAGTVAPRHMPTAASAASPTLGKKIIL
jgi:hypothetical protein